LKKPRPRKRFATWRSIRSGAAGVEDNLEWGKTVRGGSSVVNRACELIGKHLGMFQDKEPKPLTVEDLTIEQLEQILAGVKEPEPVQ